MANRDIIVSVNVIRRDAGLVVQTQTIKKELPYVQVGNVVTIVGKDGSLIYSAAGVPSNSLGVYTDLYIDTVAPNNFYQKNATNVWVLKGSLKGIKGDDGREVLIQNNGTYIQWQYEGDIEWTNIVELSTLKGDTGENIELNKSATHIQWRVVGDTNWIDLVALVDLKGADGYTPIKNVDYFDGITPTIGLNKHWFIGAIDTGIVAEGIDGEDGVTPIITIGENENWYINGVDSGKPSRGSNGTSAYEIYHAGGGTLSEVDFNESITDIPTHIEDATKHIDTTTAELSGTIDETNDKFTIWDNSLLKWIRFSFTSLKTYLNGIYHKFGGSSFGAKQIIGSTDNQDFGIITNNTERLTVLKDGNVAIGTTNPGTNLHVNGVINASISLRVNGSTAINNYGNALNVGNSGTWTSLNLLSNNIIRMTMANGGNVGINTIAPKSKLQVVGGIQCGDDTAAASADKVGTIRQRDVNNNTLLEFCKNVAGVYEWEKINDKLSLDQTTPQTITSSPKINDLLAGQMCYVDANKQLKPIDVFWDNVNKRMGIGVTPIAPLSILGVSFPVSQVIRQSASTINILASDSCIRTGSLSNGAGIARYFQLGDAGGTVRFCGSFGVKWINSTTKTMQMIFNVADNGADPTTGTEKMAINGTGEVGIGTVSPKSKLQVAGGIQCGDDTAAASADKVGTTRYRATANASYVEMCMQVSANSYSWITIVTNTW